MQEEPTDALDAERAGQLAAIGIAPGRRSIPMRGCRAILERAAPIAAGIARVVAYAPRDPDAVLYGSWRNGFVGGSYEFLRDGARLLEARTQFHYLATVVTPAMAHAQVGAGSAYAYTVHDANGDLLDGARTYRLHVDPEPAREELLGGRPLRHPDPVVADRARRPRTRPSPATTARSRPTTTAPTTSTSDLWPLRAGPRTGSRRPRASPGSRSSASTDPWNPGSTRPGASTSSNRSTDRSGAHWTSP